MSTLRTLAGVFYLVALSFIGRAQLSCVNCSGRDTTSYTNGYTNDSLYFVCQGENANLRVTWPDGGLQNVQWYRFISATNTWTPIVNQQQVSQGVYNATPGGFRAVVSNEVEGIIYEDICWVSRVNAAPIVNANTIPAGCGAVQLSGLYIGGVITGYYNPPPANFDTPYLFNDSSEIEICFNLGHPILSDLSIELVTPPACGSQIILLTDIQTPNEPDSICFNSDALGLCFSNESSLSYNLCALPSFDVSGNYGAYGTESIAIDWTPLLGCDVTQPGWQVNVRDCFGGANGSISSISMIVSEEPTEGTPIIQEFLPVPGQNLTILDTGCDSSLYTIVALERYYPESTLLSQGIGIVWETDPPFNLPNGGVGLNHLLNPGPTQDTYFSLSLSNIQLGEACGAISYDVEFFDYIQPDSTVITLTDSILCLTDSAMLITSSIADGEWIGPVDSTSEGVFFNPAAVDQGLWTIAFAPVSACIDPTEVSVLVDAAPQLSFTESFTFCSTDSIQVLTGQPSSGVWTGVGVVDSLAGTFDPTAVGADAAQLTYSLGGNCPTQANVTVAIETFVPLQILESETVVCLNALPLNLDANLSSVQWSGEGITSVNQGIFQPSSAGVGTFPIVATYNEACSDIDSVWISVDDPSIEFLNSPTVCVDADWVDMEVLATEGVWSGGGVVDSLQGLVDPTLLGAGVHYVFYTLNNTCASIDSVLISVQDFPDIQLGLPAGVCVDQSEFELLANLQGGVFSGIGVQSSGTQWLFDPSIAGEGTTIVQYDYSDVCTVTVLDTIEIYPLPELTVSADTAVCPEGQAVLFVSGAFSYGWAPNETLATPQAAETIADPEVTTVYTVAGQSGDGCFSSAQVVVEVLDSPQVSTNGPLEMCPGESEILTASGLSEVTWQGVNIENPDDLSAIVSPQETSTYVVSGVDANGCQGQASTEVIVHQPQAFFAVSDTLGVPPLEVDLTNLSNGDYFVWVPGNGDTIITTNLSEVVQAIYLGEQTHTAQLTAYLNGCPDSYALEIVTYYDSELLIIPNVVTPNGDGKNDVWRVETQNMKDMHVDIFNRWGNQVAQLEGIADKWNPEDASAGTYYFRITALGLDGEAYNHEGHFTVLKTEN